MNEIGIDLGTTNSLISVFGEQGPRLIKNSLGSVLTPSVVAIQKDTLLVGQAAKSVLVSDPSNAVSVFKRALGTEQKYKIGKKTFPAETLAGAVLSSLKTDAETDLGHPIKDVVISVPAYFSEPQRKAVRAAAQISGLNPLRLINEPTAAALAYGLQDLSQESTFVVVDLGGGTFDVSILEMFEGVMEVKATSGDAFLGGEDFTDALANHIIRQSALPDLKPQDQAAVRDIADRAKRTLSNQHEVTIQSEISATAIDLTIDRDKFEEVNKVLLARLRRPIERVLYDSKLSVSDIERVVLVGGATRMPIIRSMVGKIFQRLPESGLDPDEVVALGAAVQAGLVGRNAALDDVVMTDVSAFTLGIDTAKRVGKDYQGGFYLPIIERNTVIPVSREETLQTVAPGQTEIKTQIFQGEAPRVAQNLYLGGISVKVPHNRKECESVSIRFTYDISGLLEVEVTVLSTGKVENLTITQLAGEMSQNDIEKRLAELANLKIHPRDQAENILVRNRLEQCYAMARGDDRDLIQHNLVQFDSAIAGQNLTDIETVRQDLIAFMDDFESNYVR